MSSDLGRREETTKICTRWRRISPPVRYFVRSLTFVLLAFWQVRSFFAGGAYYNHDWVWPLTVAQLESARLLNEVPWNPSGLGSAAIAPLHHPVFLAWSLLAMLLGVGPTLVFTLAASLAALGFATASCCRRLWSAPEAVALLSGASAQLGFPVLNKLVAGHVYYLISLAALAWLLRAVMSTRRPTAGLFAASLAAGFAVIQIQLFCIAFAIVLFSAVAKKGVPAWARIAAPLLVVTQLLPTLYATLNGDAARPYMALAPERFWELNNSSPLPQGFLLLGYAPHYAERALAAVHLLNVAEALTAILLISAAVALVVQRGRRSAWTLGIGCATCIALVLGFWGPLATPLDVLFSRVAAAGVFRELYHFAGPAWLFEVLLISGLDGTRLSRAMRLCCLLAVTIVFIIMWAPTDYGGAIAHVSTPRPLIDRFSLEARADGDSRFLLWPAEWPIGPRDSNVSGNDPAAYPLGNHPAANEFRLTGPLEIAADLEREGNAAAALKWFSSAGVGRIIDEPWLSSRPSTRAPILRLPPHVDIFSGIGKSPPVADGASCTVCAYRELPVLENRADWHGQSEDAFILASDINPSVMHRCPIHLPFDQAPDPSGGWKDLGNWSWLDSRLALFGPGVVTWSTTPLSVFGCGRGAYSANVLLLSGKLQVDQHVIAARLGTPLRLRLTPGEHSVRVLDGVAAIGQVVAGDRVEFERPENDFVRSPSTVRYDWRLGVATGKVAAATKWIVLKSRYSSQWRLALKGGAVVRHVVASGYANGWQVEVGRGGAAVRIWYAPWVATEVISSLAAAIWCFTFLVLTAYALREAPQAVARFRVLR